VADFFYRVAPDIFNSFPGYRLGVIVFSNVDNSRDDPELAALLRETEAGVRSAVGGNVAELPVVAAWRGAYRSFGARPSEHRSSIEALLRRVLKPDSLPSINSLVDIGNMVSLRHLLPAGAHPVRHSATHVELRRARPGDVFRASESEAPEQLTPGEIVLADQDDVLTRRWTWRQSVVTRTQTGSKDVFFNVDGLECAGADRVEDALHEIARLVGRFCGGEVAYRGVLTSESPRFMTSLA
jgi:DNA/RNA-binding domain of Phe-tRNA-synthetase-like protein